MPAAQRVVLALGGNAIAPADHHADAAEQAATVARAMEAVADLVAGGMGIVLTHGNGPQVGDLLVRDEVARDAVPPMPLDWLVAQTQATIGYLMVTALERALAARGAGQPVVTVVSRVRVAADDPAWAAPSKPVGMWLADGAEARRRADATGQHWAHLGERGWRRVVCSPEPLESLEAPTVRGLLDGGAIVVCNGGGGVPVIRRDDGSLQGAEAVIDKDLAGALLAEEVGAARLVILTDVPGVALGYGGPSPSWLEEVDAPKLRSLQGSDEFGAGSMGPKVEAVLRFVERTGGTATIGSLDDLIAAAEGRSGTRILP